MKQQELTVQNFDEVSQIHKALKSKLPQDFVPEIGIVLGTGLGNLAETCRQLTVVEYTELLHFPQSMVSSHAGQFIFGTIKGISVVLQQGRCHLYEGYTPAQVCMGVRSMALLGIKGLIVTNASGALNSHYSAGGIMLMEDHINATGKSPLVGKNADLFGVRFPDMRAPYDGEFIHILEKTALEQGIRLEKGVYAGVLGPQMETRAETRMLRAIGADAVGMSTVQEVIAARHMGVRVAGLACLTNKNLPDCMGEASLEDIIATAEQTGSVVARLIEGALPHMAAALAQKES